jgi:hypothetical protein
MADDSGKPFTRRIISDSLKLTGALALMVFRLLVKLFHNNVGSQARVSFGGANQPKDSEERSKAHLPKQISPLMFFGAYCLFLGYLIVRSWFSAQDPWPVSGNRWLGMVNVRVPLPFRNRFSPCESLTDRVRSVGWQNLFRPGPAPTKILENLNSSGSIVA